MVAISRRGLVTGAGLLASQHLTPPTTAALPPTAAVAVLPQPGRLVAVGDIHGDSTAFRSVLSLAGLFDETSGWIGGDTVLVQIGDVLDRGDDEYDCIQLLRRLKREARMAGGAVVTMLGNHEVLNAAGVTAYASPLSAERWNARATSDRATAFLAGGELAADLATWPVACVVGDTAFCHAGLTLAQASRGLEAGNREAAAWLLGRSGSSLLPPQTLWPQTPGAPKSPLWMRDLSSPPMTEPSAAACKETSQALALLGAKRLVVGHTVQPGGINYACDASIYRIDVGLSSAMGGGVPQALEIGRDGSVKTLVARAKSQPVRAAMT